MLKKILLSTLLSFPLIFPQYITAQDLVKIGYVNSTELFESMPAKIKAVESINELNQKYHDELVLMQNNYNKRYSDFISDQGNMSENIRLRRMQELHELEKNINAFMKVAQEDIQSQDDQLIKPLREKLQQAIDEVGNEEGFTFIYDKANPLIVFVTPKAIDATPLVKRKLRR